MSNLGNAVFDRRTFVAGIGASAGLLGTGVRGWAQTIPALLVSSRQIEVNKKAATVFGITGRNGRSGIFANEGDRISGTLMNDTAKPLVMHWHGQVYAPADQDRARAGGGELAPHTSDTHDFLLTPGTHWMHSHQLTEQQLLAAPMVTREKDTGDVQDVVVMLHDFSFRSPEEILAGLGGANVHSGHGSTPPTGGKHAGHGGQGMAGHSMPMGGMQIHANDVQYDAYLANDRTLDDPETVRVERGGRVRLRIINGGTATAFFVDTGVLPATCVAVDGSPCLPHKGNRFPLAQGQRIDLVVEMPPAGGAFPILAQVEADNRRTGIILATPGASVSKIAGVADASAGHADLSLDMMLRAAKPLPQRPASRMLHLMLGEESGYRWMINGAIHGHHKPIEARVGDRLEIMFMNPTSMMHPMHLHGHHFQVVGSRGGRFSGPVRDTVIVPPHTPVFVAVDIDKPGSWFLHCHHLYHMATGMMTEIVAT